MSDMNKTVEVIRKSTKPFVTRRMVATLLEVYDAKEAENAELREALGTVKDVLDYGRRHSHGMYAFTKMKEGYEKAESLIADVLEKHKQEAK